MDRTDEHFRQSRNSPEFLVNATNNPILELGGCPIRKSERDDVPRHQSAAIRAQKVHDTTCDYFRLTRAGAGDQLQVCEVRLNRGLLRRRKSQCDLVLAVL